MKHHETANQIIIETNQNIAWGRSPDEALQEAINTCLPDAKDDVKADLFARICEASWNLKGVQACVEKALV